MQAGKRAPDLESHVQCASTPGRRATSLNARRAYDDGNEVGGGAPTETLAAWQGGMRARLEDERHRWFLWVPVLTGLGIGIYFALPFEPGLGLPVAVLFLAGVAATVFRRGTYANIATGACLAIATGFVVAKARTEWVRAPVLEKTVALAEVRGNLELIEPQAGRGQRLTIRVGSIAGLTREQTPRRVRVRVTKPGVSLRPGDAVKLTARLSPPAEPVLPGGYDFARRAWYLGIGAVGYAYKPPRADDDAPQLPSSVERLALSAGASVERVRLAIGAAIVAALPGESGAIANALLTGERGGIGAETDKAYRDSGLYHVLSISGLHMTVMAGTLFVAVRFLLAAIPGIAARFPIKIWSAVIAAVGAYGYLLISGGAFATLRSYVMISIIFLAIVAERPALAMRNIALAALTLLLVWPESLLDPGFQMSFAAVTALIAALEAYQARGESLGRSRPAHPGPIASALVFLAGIVASTLIAGVAVAPLAAYHFHTSQQYSVLGNVLALPICDLLVMPALLASLVALPLGLEAYPLIAAGAGIDAMTGVANYVARLPGAVAAIPAIPLSALLAFVAGGLWLMLWTGRWRLAGLVGLLAGLALAPMLDQPDLLVGRDASLIAARLDAGRLSAAPGARREFELSRWLEADGDRRPTSEVELGRGFQCDGVGCTAVVRGLRLSILKHPAGAAEDCARANVLVTAAARPKACSRPSVVIDGNALREGGVHAVYFAAGVMKVATVTGLRGNRPWVRQRPVRAGSAVSPKSPGNPAREPGIERPTTPPVEPDTDPAETAEDDDGQNDPG